MTTTTLPADVERALDEAENYYGGDMTQCEIKLTTLLRRESLRAAALEAEVARLTKERDNTTKALRRADSMLTAVRKIADDYHDVDVTGDPPREVACNPCANDILNLLDGNYIP